LNHQRTGSVVFVHGGDRRGREVATRDITNLSQSGGPGDVIERPIDRVRCDKDDPASIGNEVAHFDRIIVLIENEVLDPLRAVVRMKVGVVIKRREVARAIPDAADRAVAGELRTGDR
jgi:hypothetical protein